MSIGVVYVAFGAPYLAMALRSAESLRRYDPEVPAYIITNVCDAVADWNGRDRQWTYVQNTTDQNRLYKTDLFNLSPYDNTIYLDCDTLVTKSFCKQAEQFLEFFDLCIRMYPFGANPWARKAEHMVGPGSNLKVRDLPHWNSGVLFFKKNAKTQEFFRLWSASLVRLNSGVDQSALVDAILQSNVRMLSLDARWNCLSTEKYPFTHRRSHIKILHLNRLSKDDIIQIRKCGSTIPSPNATAEIERFISKERRKRREKALGDLRQRLASSIFWKDWN
jgi:hypothetical protein